MSVGLSGARPAAELDVARRYSKHFAWKSFRSTRQLHTPIPESAWGGGAVIGLEGEGGEKLRFSFLVILIDARAFHYKWV